MPQIKIVEVSPRDGLQSLTPILSVEDKVTFIKMLATTGIQQIEAGASVSPRHVPQMASSGEVFKGISGTKNVRFSALVANLKGAQLASQWQPNQLAFVIAASETFNKKNTGMDITQSLEQLTLIQRQFKLPIRVYISTAFHCPFTGKVSLSQVETLTNKLKSMGIQHLSLADTTDQATPKQIQSLLKTVFSTYPNENVALHLHNRHHLAVANLYVALESGLAVVDCAVAGLGGCPCAGDFNGNIATEIVLELLNRLNIKHNIDMDRLYLCGEYICKKLNTPYPFRHLF